MKEMKINGLFDSRKIPPPEVVKVIQVIRQYFDNPHWFNLLSGLRVIFCYRMERDLNVAAFEEDWKALNVQEQAAMKEFVEFCYLPPESTVPAPKNPSREEAIKALLNTDSIPDPLNDDRPVVNVWDAKARLTMRVLARRMSS